MKKYNKYLSLLCCLLCVCLCMSACNQENAATTAATEPAKDAIYTITVKTAGGMVLEDLVAYVYEDSTEDDLLTFGTLDNNGSFTFTAPQSDKYTVRFDNVPAEGYDLQAYYAITSTNTQITLTSSVVTGKDVLETNKTYTLGSVMRDFTVTTVDGQELTLSKILEEKQAVVLNFWFTGCDPCRAEFPLLQAAYAEYSDLIEVITMNPTDYSRDTVEEIQAFRDSFGLTMPMATCSSKWESALKGHFTGYPTTVIIDRYGVVCLIDSGAVTDAGVFEAAFAHFTAEDYEQKMLNGFSELHVVEYPLGDVKNPMEAYGGMEEFAVTVAAGAEYHVSLFRADGIILHIEDSSAYLIVDGVRYDPNSKGVIEVEIKNPEVTTPNNLIIGNSGATESKIMVEMLLPQGTFTNPYEGALGENSVTVKEGNDQGVYYLWTAPADGVLTITVTNVPNNKFDIQLYNLTSYAVRNMNEEELLDENGNRYMSVQVRAGDQISIGYMSVPDENYKYPKVTVKTVISFSEGIEVVPNYNITVKDGEGNPMPGISVSLTVDGVNTVFTSDENGLIAMVLPDGFYTVKVSVPEGYVCDTTQFLLTAANPNKEIVVSVYVPQEVAYTVYVVDELGNPVQGAAVVLGDSFFYTDANGMVSVILLESKDYVATVVAPEGYTIDKSKHAFGDKTVLTVTVQTAEPVQEEVDYTVTVVDSNGKPYTNLLVRFDSDDGSVSVTEPVGSNGKVTVRLLKTNYTVTLVFNAGTVMGYEAANTRLTANEPSVTIEVVPYVSGESEMLFVNGGDYEAINVGTGSFYVDMTGTEIRYFLFTPEENGVYTFTTTNANAAIGYWSTSFFAFDCSAEYVKDNVCTLEVKNVGPTYVISVKGDEGISGTILKIARVGDAQENKVAEEIYTGTTTPTEPFVVNESGSKSYLNLAIEQILVKGDDGFYHLGSAEGPVVYMDLTNARFGISISALVNNGPMRKYEYDADGKPVKRTDYTECMLKYVENVDKATGVYALTDDLITILQNHGNHAGWYDAGGYGYLFDTDPVLEGQGWMFLLCVFQ